MVAQLTRQVFRNESNSLVRLTPVQVVPRDEDTVLQELMTDAFGQVDFYIEPGQYDYLVNGAREPFDVQYPWGAYDYALDRGFSGSVDEYLASLVGPKGDKGDKGDQGNQGLQGLKGDTGNPTTFELRGNGIPEGVVAAPIGTYYTDESQTRGALRWFKSSGTGNTGWQVEIGDTGRRDISGLVLNGWTAPTNGLVLRRFNNVCTLEIAGLNPINATGPIFVQLLAGFWHGGKNDYYLTTIDNNGTSDDVRGIQMGSTGLITLRTINILTSTGTVYTTIQWICPGGGGGNHWPASLPGSVVT